MIKSGYVVNFIKLIWVLMLCMLGKNFSRQHFEIVFLFFAENRLHISRKLSLKKPASVAWLDTHLTCDLEVVGSTPAGLVTSFHGD